MNVFLFDENFSSPYSAANGSNYNNNNNYYYCYYYTDVVLPIFVLFPSPTSLSASR